MKLSKQEAQKSNLCISRAPSSRPNRSLESWKKQERKGHIQFLTILVLLLLRQSVLGLRNLELPMSLERNETDSEIGSSQIESKVLPYFLAGRPLPLALFSHFSRSRAYAEHESGN